MILVTGAGGALGGLVVDRLRADHRAPIVAGTRAPDRLEADVPVRRIDFDDPRSLAKGFAGVDVLLLISAGYAESDVVISRHAAAIDAAEAAGVRHVVYTSLAGAGDHLAYSVPHRWTERRLARGRTAWTILRNGLYAELLVPAAMQAAATGVLTAPLGDGRLAAAAREDLADAAARVLLAAERHAGQTYELVGDTAIGGAELAGAVSRTTGDRVEYRPGTLGELRAAMSGPDVPAWRVENVVSTHAVIAAGFMGGTDGTLAELVGEVRPALATVEAAVGMPTG